MNKQLSSPENAGPFTFFNNLFLVRINLPLLLFLILPYYVFSQEDGWSASNNNTERNYDYHSSINTNNSTEINLSNNPNNISIKNSESVNDWLIFEMPEKMVGKIVMIYDITRKIYYRNETHSNKEKINVAALAKGEYILSIGGQQLRFTKK